MNGAPNNLPAILGPSGGHFWCIMWCGVAGGERVPPLPLGWFFILECISFIFITIEIPIIWIWSTWIFIIRNKICYCREFHFSTCTLFPYFIMYVLTELIWVLQIISAPSLLNNVFHYLRVKTCSVCVKTCFIRLKILGSPPYSTVVSPLNGWDLWSHLKNNLSTENSLLVRPPVTSSRNQRKQTEIGTNRIFCCQVMSFPL